MTTTRRGRPRIAEQRRAGATPTEEILDAAAELFAASGFAKTSTRSIAEAVGIRQASLYHHFATKNDILDRLLTSTVEPPLAFAHWVATAGARPAVAMFAMSWFDTHQLLSSKWNIGALLQLPEARDPQFGRFFAMHQELDQQYRSLAREVVAGAGSGPAQAQVLVRLPFHFAESAIALRVDDPQWVRSTGPAEVAREIAVATLRALGVDDVEAAAKDGMALAAQFPAQFAGN